MLCKIVIVDDEWIIRKSIAATIRDFCPESFEIVGMASNGMEGMEIIQSLRPDIVITDVKMPRLDGIEMVHRLKESGVAFSCLFISGFDEFAYVKKAIDLKAEKYLLKPVNTKELTDVLLRLTKQKEQEAILSGQLEKASRALQESTVAHLLTTGLRFGRITPEEAQSLKTQLPYSRFCVLMFLPENGPEDLYSSHNMEPYLLKYAAYNIVQELLCEKWPAMFYYSDERWFAAIVNLRDTEETMDAVFQCCATISKQVRQHFSAFVTMGAGTICTSLEQCARSFQEAAEALEYRGLYGKGTLIPYQALPAAGPKDENFDFTKSQQAFVQAIQTGDQQQAETVLEEFRQALIANSDKTLARTKATATALLLLVTKEMSAWCTDLDILQTSFSAAARKIQGFETLQEIYEQFRAEILMLTNLTSDNQNNQQKWIIAQAKAYIDNNYMDQKLPLQSVAAQVHVSATYLSILFKRECGENFIDYVTSLRMKKAQELLLTTDYKTGEIARRVGYANAQYLSLCFKKYFGCSPGRFRTSNRK